MSTKDRFISWEKLRPLYNLVLMGVGFSIAMNFHAIATRIEARLFNVEANVLCSTATLLWAVVFFVMAANVLYFLGLAAEMCVLTFTRHHMGRSRRLMLFIVGLFVSLGLQLFVLMYVGLHQ